MKYIEELNIGDCFGLNGRDYILTTDFKANGSKLAICLLDGSAKWVAAELIVVPTDIFKLDNDNNIVAIKPRSKNDTNKNNDIS